MSYELPPEYGGVVRHDRWLGPALTDVLVTETAPGPPPPPVAPATRVVVFEVTGTGTAC